MLLKSNSNAIAFVGGTVVLRVKEGQYERVRADIVFKDGIIQEIYKYSGEADENFTGKIKNDFGNETLIINMDRECIIFPGLIDLHNHFDYNTMPLWERPITQPWDNRHEWRHKNCKEYQDVIKNFYNFIIKSWDNEKVAKVMRFLQFFSEVQAVSGGTTVLQEPSDIFYGDNPPKAEHMLMRSTGVPQDLGFSLNQNVQSIIDFFKPNFDSDPDDKKYIPPLDTSSWQIKEAVNSATQKTYFQEYLELLKKPVEYIKENSGGYLVHLAEGRAGNLLKEKGIDAYSKKEFEYLKENIKKIPGYGEKVRASKLSIIHGCGIDLNTSDNIRFIFECGIGLIWSPVSNLLLYDDTPDFFNKLYGSVRLCLGSDWAPSGSKHLWDEGSFAQKYLLKHHPKDAVLSDKILEMMTYNPALTLNSNKLGDIKKGAFADFYIVSKNRRLYLDGAPLGDIFFYSDYHTVGTVINGNLIYGIKDLFDKWGQSGVSIACDGKEAKEHMVHIPPQIGINTEKDFEEALKTVDTLFAAYSKEIGKSFVRSKILTANDEPYSKQIKKLCDKFNL